jgi:hypothetical protein
MDDHQLGTIPGQGLLGTGTSKEDRSVPVQMQENDKISQYDKQKSE